MNEQRRWGRVVVPESKIKCRVKEPAVSNEPIDIPLIDVSAGGISFYCEQELKVGELINLLMRFPSSFYLEEGTVWGKVAHCKKQDNKYLVGIAFVRRKKAG